jgi:hypothetical protein
MLPFRIPFSPAPFPISIAHVPSPAPILTSPTKACADFPASIFASSLLTSYPSAKVILTTRPEESWITSMESTLVFRHTASDADTSRPMYALAERYHRYCWYASPSREPELLSGQGTVFGRQRQLSRTRPKPPNRPFAQGLYSLDHSLNTDDCFFMIGWASISTVRALISGNVPSFGFRLTNTGETGRTTLSGMERSMPESGMKV